MLPGNNNPPAFTKPRLCLSIPPESNQMSVTKLSVKQQSLMILRHCV